MKRIKTLSLAFCVSSFLPLFATAQTNPLEQYLGKAAPILQNINIAKTFEAVKTILTPTTQKAADTPKAADTATPVKNAETPVKAAETPPTKGKSDKFAETTAATTGKNSENVEQPTSAKPGRGKAVPVSSQATGTGETNWSEGYIQATGRCFLSPDKFKVPGQAEELCKEGAKVMARRNLLAMTKEVRIIDTVTLLNQMFDRQVTYQILDGWVKGSEQVGDYRITEHYVEVTMRMPLYKGNASVAAVAAQSIGQNPNAAPLFKQMAPTISNTGVAMNPETLNDLRNDMQNAGITMPADGSLPVVLNTRTADGSPVKPSLFPNVKVKMPDGSEQSVNLAQYFPNMVGGGDFPRYFQASKDVVTALTGKNMPILDMVQTKDGSFSLDLAKMPSNNKFGKFMKDFGKVALDVLKVAVHIIL